MPQLLPLALRGLDRAGVERSDSEPLLDVIEARVRADRTGARWQRQLLTDLVKQGNNRSLFVLVTPRLKPDDSHLRCICV